MDNGTCAIWGTPTTITNNGGPPEYDSPRAGGKYRLGTNHSQDFIHRSNAFKAKLTSWLVEQRMSGIESPDFSGGGDFYDEIDRRRDLSISDKIERLLRFCSEIRVRPGQAIYTFSKSKEFRQPIIGLVSEEIYAWTETLNFQEFLHFRQILRQLSIVEGYVKISGDADFDVLTASGFAKLEELERSNKNSKQAFVAMWFDPNDKTTFEDGIKPAIEFDPYGKPTGFRAFRVDQEHHTDFIMDFMIGNIKRSRFMVADFTSFMVKGHRVMDGQTLSAEALDYQIGRGGVYYEAGYAMGLGIPVIATCRKSQTEHIHFDLKQFNTIYWVDVADLKEQLSNRIFSMFVT